MNDNSIIMGAYLAGFVPSTDTLTGEVLLSEAEDFLFNIQFQ